MSTPWKASFQDAVLFLVGVCSEVWATLRMADPPLLCEALPWHLFSMLPLLFLDVRGNVQKLYRAYPAECHLPLHDVLVQRPLWDSSGLEGIQARSVQWCFLCLPVLSVGNLVGRGMVGSEAFWVCVLQISPILHLDQSFWNGKKKKETHKLKTVFRCCGNRTWVLSLEL